MSFKAIVQRIHLWSGLILGLQVLLWMVSGVFMSWFHIETVRGEHNRFQSVSQELVSATYASPGGIIAQADGATTLKLRLLRARPVYEVTDIHGTTLYNARTGELISPLDEQTIREIAETDFIGDGKLVSLTLMEETPHEYRKELPVWRADFDDKRHTRLYISQNTGDVLSRRNDIWRVYDFLWMLHIMDYDEREDFNNPLVKIASAAGLIFALSGMIIVILRLKRGRYGNDMQLAIGGGKQKKAPIEKD